MKNFLVLHFGLYILSLPENYMFYESSCSPIDFVS
jgi:hypothetical protein